MKYAKGSTQLMCADRSKLMIAVALVPAHGLPANSQLALPRAIGRIRFSTQ